MIEKFTNKGYRIVTYRHALMVASHKMKDKDKSIVIDGNDKLLFASKPFGELGVIACICYCAILNHECFRMVSMLGLVMGSGTR